MANEISALAAVAFRDFVTAGNPLSGLYEPAKSEIRDLFDEINTKVETALATGGSVFAEFVTAGPSTNANNLIDGFHIATAGVGLNFPDMSSTFRIVSFQATAGAATGQQVAMSGQGMWLRAKVASAWGAWTRVLTDANTPLHTLAEAQAGVATGGIMDAALVRAAILAQGAGAASHQQVSALTGGPYRKGPTKYSAAQASAAFITASGEIAVCGSSFSAGLPYAADTAIQTPRVLSYESGLVAPALPFVQVEQTQGGIYALDSNGWVWSAGLNSAGALGHGDTIQRRALKRIELFVTNGTPVAEVIAPYPAFTMVAGGTTDFVLFRLVNGQLWACGANATGQLGDGTTTARSTPVRCGTLTGIVQCKASTQFSVTGDGVVFALASGGVLSAWGSNVNGAFGDGTTTNRNAPGALSVSNVTSFDISFEWTGSAAFSYAVAVSGTTGVWGAGSNNTGQLGDGTTTNRLTWTQSLVTSGVSAGASAISTAGGNGGTTAVLMADGTIRTWGFNTQGQCGAGDVVNPKLAPVTPQFNGAALNVGAAGRVLVMGAASTTRVYAFTPGSSTQRDIFGWGVGSGGALKTDGNFTAIVNAPRRMTLPVTGLPVVDISPAGDKTAAGGALHALLSNGRVYGTGGNPIGSLGTSPNLVTGQDGWTQVLLGA